MVASLWRDPWYGSWFHLYDIHKQPVVREFDSLLLFDKRTGYPSLLWKSIEKFDLDGYHKPGDQRPMFVIGAPSLTHFQFSGNTDYACEFKNLNALKEASVYAYWYEYNVVLKMLYAVAKVKVLRLLGGVLEMLEKSKLMGHSFELPVFSNLSSHSISHGHVIQEACSGRCFFAPLGCKLSHSQVESFIWSVLQIKCWVCLWTILRRLRCITSTIIGRIRKRSNTLSKISSRWRRWFYISVDQWTLRESCNYRWASVGAVAIVL